jgi:outer membrane protein
MKFFGCLILAPCLALSLAVFCCQALAADDLLTVYAQARAADPQLAAASAQRGAQDQAALIARAALLPQWQLSASDTRNTADGSRSHQLSSSISQTLLDLARSRSWSAAQTQAAAEAARVRLAEQELCARVARAYFGVLSAQASLAAAQANEDAFAAQAAQSQSRLAAGLSAQLDVDQARAYYELAKGNTVQALQVLAAARDGLTQLSGKAPAALKPLRAELPEAALRPAESAAWVEQAQRLHPQLQAQALSVAASEERVAAARAGHWPTLALALEGGRNGSNNPTQVALRLNVPLFAGGATQSSVQQAAYQRDVQREDLETQRRAVVREVQLQFQAVQSSQALMHSARAAVAAAGRALASTRVGQNLGTRSLTDLLLAIQTQTSAQNALDQARHAYVLARLLLHNAAGTLGETTLAEVNPWLEGNS